MDIKKLTIDEPAYPALLKQIKDPPKELYYAGDVSLLSTRCVAVVGSRKFTAYGRRIAGRIAGRLAACGVTVVSGMAIGIDGIGHRSALEAGGRTIAVLGNGLDVMYPAANRELKADILRRGLLISEYPLGMKGTKYTFPQRNRIISGLSEATVVVEAGLNSGSLITACLAEEQGRPVYGVPGNIDAVTSHGVNMLIRDGAVPLVDVDDLLQDLHVDRQALWRESYAGVVGEEERKILELLSSGGEATIDQIAMKLGATAGKINGLVSVLEMKGLVMTALGRVFLSV